MSKRYIITLMAANRVGILAAVTTSLAELGGDIQEVSQTVMQGFFTIIMSAEFPEHRDPSVIIDHIRGVCRPFGVEVSLKDPKLETLQDAPSDGIEKYFLTAEGEDKPGMIRQISARLAQEEIDITDVFARRADNGKTFVMVMELAVPGVVDALALQQELEQLGSAVGLSAALQHEDIFSATNDPRPVRLSMRLRKSLTPKSETATKVQQPTGT
jgi:glycine cleavage system transcriptional repressor